jgi:hypothetical protein
LLRGTLAILIGVSIVTILVAYGGVGINLLLAIHRDEVPHESVLLYAIMVSYFLGAGLLLLIAALLTIAEFADWKIRSQRGLIYTTFFVLLALACTHLVVSLGAVSVSDQEAKDLFVDGAIPYSVLTILMVGLFLVLHRTRRAS